MMGQSQCVRNGNEIAPGNDNSNVLCIERGNQGFTVTNKPEEPFDIKAATTSRLQIGYYLKPHYNFNVNVAVGDGRQQLRHSVG